MADSNGLKGIKFPGLDGIYEVPQVDSTLSKSGSAADAKETGDRLSKLNRWAKSVNDTDMNTVKTSGFYFGYTGMTNAAFNSISVWEVIAYSGDWGVQRQTVLYNDGSGKTYERRWYGSGGSNWTPWKVILDSENWSDYISVSSGGTTETGMGREFSGANNTGSYTTPGKTSKFYIVTLSVEGKTHSLTVDYKSVSAATGKTRDFGIPDSQYTLRVKINSDGTATFDLGTVGTIEYVSGYY